MKPVDLVTIYDLIPIYKDGSEANAIQVARVENSDGEQLQYDIIVGKNLYNVGDEVVYIQPDYCLPQKNMFLEYHAPGGDTSKCKLGKRGRIKSIKFNFNFDNQPAPIYSIGIILPIDSEIKEILDTNPEDLMAAFGVTKYSADDSFDNNGQMSGMAEEFPTFLYHTDETTIQNNKRGVDNCFSSNEVLSFTIKRDGSSITEYYVDDSEYGVCSRQQKKKLDQSYVKLYVDNGVNLHPYFQKDTGTPGWYNDATQTFYTNEEAQATLEPVTEVRADAWVDTVNKHGYLDRFVEFCRENGVKLALRGELVGQGNKGSGNKLNMDAKTNWSDVVWFGIDDLSSGFSKRINYSDPLYNLAAVCDKLSFDYTKPVLEGVFDYAGIIRECHRIFDEIKSNTGQIVEGIVIRTKYSNYLSVKYINPEYDAKS